MKVMINSYQIVIDLRLPSCAEITESIYRVYLGIITFIMALPPERITIQLEIRANLQKYPQYCSLPDDEQTAIVRRIERSCFNASIDSAVRHGVAREFTNARYVQLYSAECMRVMSNICPDTAFDDYLPVGICNGTVDVTKIADLKNEELNPAASKAERDEIEARQNQKTEIKVSRRFKCRKCGHNETKPIEYQARAGDEAGSMSYKCVQCGDVWRN